MQVIKRDSKKVEFNKVKIVTAIKKAMTEVDELNCDTANRIANEISKIEVNEIHVEDIQDIVEEKLMNSKLKKTARAYVRYRYDRERIRRSKDYLMKEVAEKLMATNVQNQNANVDEKSFGGRMGEANDVVMKDYALNNCMSEMAKNNHLNNEIYIHDLSHYTVGDHNCYNSETALITNDGVKKFKELCDGQVVKVIDYNGNWREATVRKYGKQKMYDLTFSSGLTKKIVTCTRNHRWVLLDGSVTDNIQIGDKLFLTQELDSKFEIDEKLWCFGFVIGDGCDKVMRSKDGKRITNGTMQVRLCGNKTKYLNRFMNCGWSIAQQFENGDIILISRGNGSYKQSFLNNKMWKMMSHNDICNIFNGYMCADGHMENLTVSTSDDRIKEFIEYCSGVVGYYLISQKTKVDNTNFKEGRTLHEFKFIKRQSNNRPWKLESVYANRNGEHGIQVAWCVEEPITHTFTLDNGMVTGNCLSIPFDDLLANGFNTRQTDVRPANSVNTAFQLVAVIFQLQSLQQFGGVSATHLDWTMIPYVRKSFFKHFKDGIKYLEDGGLEDIENGYITNRTSIDADVYKSIAYTKAYKYAMDMTEREVKQGAEGLFHNLNTLQSRSGNQLPFTSINYGTCTKPEGRMVTKALLEVSIEGLGKLHKTSIFPCGIFQCMKGVNRKPGDKNYDLFKLALRSTAQRLYPNYANVDWSNNAGYDINDPRTYFSTMGCRTANGWDINGFGQLKDGRGNICPVTIIMPTLAMEAIEKIWSQLPELSKDKITISPYDWGKGEKAIIYFMKLLDEKIHEAKDMLLERFEWICSQPMESAKFMYENGLMAGYVPKEGIRSALRHGTLALGQIGLAETLQILIGKDHTTEDGMKLAKRIEQLFKDRCNEFKEEYKLNFGVYFTPAENLCYTAMKKFKEKYGVIKKVSDKDFFTNSIHVPVWKEMNPFEKIDIESQLTGYSNAGCITYVELDSTCKNNLEALEEIINYAMDKDIPYFAINVPNDTCLECGYCDEFNDKCPMCGSKHIQQLRRVTGYLTGDYKSAFNKGKQQEVILRFKNSQKLENWRK